MLINKKGDLLKATENIICHQCNTKGIFGGGLAYQIKQAYPLCEIRTMEYVDIKKEKNEEYLGNYFLYVNKPEKRLIANCFTQNEDYSTNYEKLKECFTKLLTSCKDMKQTIAVPKNFGCGIASGNWQIVSKIFEDLSNEYGVDIVVYEFDK